MRIQREVEKKKILERIVAISEELLQSAGSELNYQKITDNILDISGAKYAGFNLYDEEGSKSITVAFSAPEGIIKKISSLLGFKLVGKKWDHDPVRTEKIKSHTITHFSTLSEIAGDLIAKPVAFLLGKTFNFGEVVIVKILKENIMLGDFTLIMPRNVKFKNDNYVEIYTRQIGLLITRQKTTKALQESEERYRNLFASSRDAVMTLEPPSWNFTSGNPATLEMFKAKNEAEFLLCKPWELSPELQPDGRASGEKSKEMIETAMCKGSHFFEWVHKRTNGEEFAAEVLLSRIEQNEKVFLLAVVRDITRRKKVEHIIGERLKELQVFYELAQIIEKEGITLDKLYQETANILQKSWQYPEITCARVVIGDNEFRTKNFMESAWKQSTPINEHGSVAGRVEVGYLEERREEGEGPFLKEERLLLDTIAERLGHITERKKTEEALWESEEIFRSFMEYSPIYVFFKDENVRALRLSKNYETMLGKPVEELLGKSMDKLFPSELAKNMVADDMRVMKEGKVVTVEEELDDRFYSTIKFPIFIEGKPRYLAGYTTDITERKNAENKIIYLSYHDQLTGLYNRRFAKEEIKRLDTKRQLPLSVIMGDLNSLKLTNDTFGHSKGDKMLKGTARLLKRMCRSDDILSRWGGDEFVILLPKTSITDSEEIVQRIKKECKKLIIQKIPISISIGVATKIEVGQDMDEIIIEAESNMYKNKLVEKESNASSIIFALEQALYEKSNETIEHTFRIKDFAIKLGESIKLPVNQLDELSLLASLHDIGKVAIPETILLKEGKLTEKEWAVIKRHPEIGFNIAQSSPQIIHIAKFILACHENWDGSGYPKGLTGESIPVVSRVISIADAYDVMTSERIYKKAMSKPEAIEELKRCAGTQFDPVLINKFIEIISK